MTQLRALYQQTDALLFPSLGEGWGLPLIESIACALPAVCTDYGGQSEYLSEVRQCYTPIQYNLSPVRFAPEEADLESKVDPRALWAYPRINELAAAMSSVVCESTSLRSGRALEAAEHVRRNFSWTIAADKLMKLIDQMKRQR